MKSVRIAPIVEGAGECEAVPELIRRIAREIDPGFSLQILKPFRISASKLRKNGEMETAVELMARKLQGPGGIIVIVDCDDDCPAREGPALLQRAKNSRPDLPTAVILAKKEYEAWFLAAAESLRGERNLAGDLQSPTDPESIRGAKEWLSERMPHGMSYSATNDQPALTAKFNMALARKKSDSFDKCYRDIRGILEALWENAGNEGT